MIAFGVKLFGTRKEIIAYGFDNFIADCIKGNCSAEYIQLIKDLERFDNQIVMLGGYLDYYQELKCNVIILHLSYVKKISCLVVPPIFEYIDELDKVLEELVILNTEETILSRYFMYQATKLKTITHYGELYYILCYTHDDGDKIELTTEECEDEEIHVTSDIIDGLCVKHIIRKENM